MKEEIVRIKTFKGYYWVTTLMLQLNDQVLGVSISARLCKLTTYDISTRFRDLHGLIIIYHGFDSYLAT